MEPWGNLFGCFTLSLVAVLVVLAVLFPLDLLRPEVFYSAPEAGEVVDSSLQGAISTKKAQVKVTLEPTPAILIGAGDISVCGSDGDDRTGRLIERLLMLYPDAVVFTAGDNAQSMGFLSEYTDCFFPAWGKFLERIRPSPGNHDWFNNQGSDYFTFFAEAAGPAGLGYYSYDIGEWHIVSLNSNCEATDCSRESAQAQWLITDLTESQKPCQLLYWHHPLWTSGTVPVSPAAQDFWRIASEYDAEIVVNGHDHHYERFALLDSDGTAQDQYGIRLFIVGTGGAWLFDLAEPLATTEVRDNTTLGVIVFYLFPDRYDWEFIPAEGGSFTDRGSGQCTDRDLR